MDTAVVVVAAVMGRPSLSPSQAPSSSRRTSLATLLPIPSPAKAAGGARCPLRKSGRMAPGWSATSLELARAHRTKVEAPTGQVEPLQQLRQPPRPKGPQPTAERITDNIRESSASGSDAFTMCRSASCKSTRLLNPFCACPLPCSSVRGRRLRPSMDPLSCSLPPTGVPLVTP